MIWGMKTAIITVLLRNIYIFNYWEKTVGLRDDLDKCSHFILKKEKEQKKEDLCYAGRYLVWKNKRA